MLMLYCLLLHWGYFSEVDKRAVSGFEFGTLNPFLPTTKIGRETILFCFENEVGRLPNKLPLGCVLPLEPIIQESGNEFTKRTAHA